MSEKHHDQVPHVTCEHLLDIHGKEKKEHVVIDLRDVGEFEAGHIKGSLNIPRRELATNIDNLLPDKDKRVIVIVGPTQEGELKAIHDQLVGLGYDSSEFLAGGFDKWCDIAPLEVEPDLTELTPEEQGFTGEHEPGTDDDLDPKHDENDPLY